MFDIYKRYAIKIQADFEKLYFLYNGSMINPEEKLNDIIKKDENIINMFANELDEDDEDNKIYLKQSKDIICPICKEICYIEIKDYKIILYNCKNKHKKENILIKEYNDTQNINISNIICNICKERNKGNIENNKFYQCINCKLNLCHICKINHNDDHYIVNYDKINYICKKHLQLYFGYCLNCNKNICINCEKEHDDHSEHHRRECADRKGRQ
jgi:hypothetical protein